MFILALLQAGQWVLGPFQRDSVINPILGPNPKSAFVCPMTKKTVLWEHDHVFNPAAVTRNGKVYLLYRAEDNSGAGIGGHTSRIGLAESDDGLHFGKLKVPVLFPGNDIGKPYEWTGGCEDPRVVQSPTGFYVMTYTGWNRKTARLCVATSKDLVHWQKSGPAFRKTKFRDTWSKSGAIVTKLDHNRVVAAKIAGKFWMYWGDQSVNLASSPNLTDWTPVTDRDGKLRAVLTPRPDKFDSSLCESGPPALLTKNGIVLIYNGRNGDKGGDKSLGPGEYAAGQALFDPKNPGRLITRMDKYFFRPELTAEKTGQYSSGTVFTEGLALFKGRWFLYYGAADSFVGVAEATQR